MEEDYFERFFETFVRTMHDCSEAWERKTENFSYSSNRPCSEPGRHSADVSNIVADCQKNRCPSLISCPYNLRWLAWNNVSSVWRNDVRRSCPKQTVSLSTVCYKINLTWYPVSSKLVSYTCEHWRLIVYYLYQKLWILISICWSYLKI